VSVPSELFDDDYLYFYAEAIGPSRSDAEAEVIAELLSLEPGMRVLDVPCGEGRISGRLARRGCRVVGIDTNDRWVALGRERYPEVSFDPGDMRSLSYVDEFDAAVNWFTSFGYFDPATNDRVLASFARALRPGGKLLLDVHNAWRLARVMAATGGTAGAVFEREGNLMADRITYDDATRRSRTERFIVRDGELRTVEFSLEQVPAPQLIGRLRRAGFATVRLFGDGGAEFDPEGRRLIVVAQRSDGTKSAVRPRMTLREVSDDNGRAVCELKLAPGQDTYVAPASYTLVEGGHDPQAWIRAIYADETPVGVLALHAEPEAEKYFLVRLMIGAQHQGQGFGSAAVGLVAEYVRGLPGARRLETSCVPGPDSPTGFYRRLGFEDTGVVWHGENVLALAL